jgi:hypothetical protein
MVQKFGHFEEYIINTCKVLKDGAECGEGWRRSVGVIT